MTRANMLILALASGLFLNAGCSSSGGSDSTTGSGPLGSAVMGPSDGHCDGHLGTVDPDVCMTPPASTGEGGAMDEPAGGAAGASDCNQTHDAKYGNTLYNDEGDDDDCKYHAKWQSTPIRLDANVTFTVTAQDLSSMMPLGALSDGAVPLSSLEVYQPCQPTRRGPAQNHTPKIAQTSAGVYTAGPIKFDQPGRWVVRFHFYEECFDQDTSPHSHIAFFIDVPE